MPRPKSIRYLVLLALAIGAPFILSNFYQRELLVLCCIFAILALSYDIILGGLGQLSLGHQSFFGIGAYTSALITLRLGTSVWLGYLAAIVFSGLCGLFVGYVCLRRARGLYLAMITFGLAAILLLVACQWYDVTGGLSGLTRLPSPQAFGFEFKSELSYYYLVLAMLLLAIYFRMRLWRSRLGRAIMSIRDNEPLASSIGISSTFYYTMAFGIACAMAGFSGALYAHHLHVVNPLLFGFTYLMMLIVAVLVGGVGTTGGPLLGIIIYVWVSELLRFSQEWRFVIFGAILVIFLIFKPQGIYPSLVSLGGRFRRQRGG